MSIFDHIGISVSDYARAKDFYVRALAPLGIGVLMELTDEQTGGAGAFAGLGSLATKRPQFWISPGERMTPHAHVAFAAADRGAVDAFYKAALAAGGSDNGPPGIRPHYHANYYGAFVLDPDDHNVEAVCHTG